MTLGDKIGKLRRLLPKWLLIACRPKAYGAWSALRNAPSGLPNSASFRDDRVTVGNVNIGVIETLSHV